jgi:hypothetical protein
MKDGIFLDYLTVHQLLKWDGAPWSEFCLLVICSKQKNRNCGKAVLDTVHYLRYHLYVYRSIKPTQNSSEVLSACILKTRYGTEHYYFVWSRFLWLMPGYKSGPSGYLSIKSTAVNFKCDLPVKWGMQGGLWLLLITRRGCGG